MVPPGGPPTESLENRMMPRPTGRFMPVILAAFLIAGPALAFQISNENRRRRWFGHRALSSGYVLG